MSIDFLKGINRYSIYIEYLLISLRKSIYLEYLLISLRKSIDIQYNAHRMSPDLTKSLVRRPRPAREAGKDVDMVTKT